MPKPLSEDLRQRVIDYCNEGLIQKRIADILKVSTSFVSRLIKRYKEEKTIKPKKPQITRPFKLNYEKVITYIQNNPDKTLKEVGKEFNVSDVAILYIFKKLGITNKKKTLDTLKEIKKREKNL